MTFGPDVRCRTVVASEVASNGAPTNEEIDMEQQSPGIVVGVDGSADSLGALRWALHEAIGRGCPVEVVHCWHPQSAVDSLFASAQEMRVGSECMLQNEVATAAEELTTIPEITRTSVHGRPVPTLITASERALLLVVGARGYTGLKQHLFGHVTDGCVRHARCPVVVVDRAGVVVQDPTATEPATLV